LRGISIITVDFCGHIWRYVNIWVCRIKLVNLNFSQSLTLAGSQFPKFCLFVFVTLGDLSSSLYKMFFQLGFEIIRVCLWKIFLFQDSSNVDRSSLDFLVPGYSNRLLWIRRGMPHVIDAGNLSQLLFKCLFLPQLRQKDIWKNQCVSVLLLLGKLRKSVFPKLLGQGENLNG